MNINAAELLKALQRTEQRADLTARYSSSLSALELLVKSLIEAEHEIEQLKAQLTTNQKQLIQLQTALNQAQEAATNQQPLTKKED